MTDRAATSAPELETKMKAVLYTLAATAAVFSAILSDSPSKSMVALTLMLGLVVAAVLYPNKDWPE